ncbi:MULTISPECIES: ATP-dependent zinc protease [Halomonadaceae]|nr:MULTISPECIES: ATP-dependent zinc protease [Halomonas]QJQ97209.1 ATP-dependent zinc protease [Halomonas sp. PA5]
MGEAEPSLARDDFNLRIDELEQRLVERCVQQHALSERQQQQAFDLSMEVRDVGSLVRHLRADIENLNVDSNTEPSQCVASQETRFDNREVLGRSEWIGLPSVGTYLKARIDSGANTSSLSASEITRFERDGENWVRFKLALSDEDVVVEQVRDEWIEAPVIRRVRILQAAGSDTRPVVSLLMTLGPIREQVEFTLNDRSHLNYPVLLGRRFMMDIAMIDVAESYLHPRPEFPGGRPAEEAATDEVDTEDNDEEA